MALDFILESLEGVNDALKSEYIEKDGKFYLDLKGDDVNKLTGALGNERLKSKNFETELKALKKRTDGIDLDAARKILEKAQDEQEKELLKTGNIEDVVKSRISKIVEDKDSELAKRDEKISKLSGRALKNIFVEVAVKAGVFPSAVDDVFNAGKDIFRMDEDFKTAFKPGEDNKPILSKDGKENYSPVHWLEEMKTQKPHWFPANASGVNTPGNPGNKNNNKNAESPEERINRARGL